MNSSIESSSAMDTIVAMCRQEEKYLAGDYLFQEQVAESTMTGPLNEQEAATMIDIDVDCRTKMAAWCYRVVDFCQFDHETVAISMNILDRFMLSTQGQAAKEDRRTYQLAAMTSLYTAVKIHEPEAMDPALIAKISHGTYTEQEVEDMEVQILQGVSWRVNTPTALSFVRECLDLVDNQDLDEFERETVYHLAKVQTELAVSEYEFMSIRPSVVAYCSLMNALTSLGVEGCTLQQLWSTIAGAVSIGLDNTDSKLVVDVQNYLYEAYLQEPEAQNIIQTCNPQLVNGLMMTESSSAVDNAMTGNKAIITATSPSSSPRSISATTTL
uniref:Cyclin-like domain-containing protein n=1 Tax=Entomoneis paludosa TaxID=265537 RepID=A0A7S2V9U5_9STRA|mmetsp:Transcript_13671/g.28241  ORF Transcript_13671/g.28241 Transcript_13671/m.28241 type:complete len:327 (+) Transcript_13671:82-1062(+)